MSRGQQVEILQNPSSNYPDMAFVRLVSLQTVSESNATPASSSSQASGQPEGLVPLSCLKLNPARSQPKNNLDLDTGKRNKSVCFKLRMHSWVF